MKKRFLALFIVLAMLLSQLSVFAIVPDLSITSINPEDKLTDELKEVMSNTPDGEYISICINLDSHDDSDIYKILSQRAGDTITAESEELFIEKRIEAKIEQYNSYVEMISESQISVMSTNAQAKSIGIQNIRTVCDLSAILTNEELTTCVNEGMSIEEIIELSERNQFLFDWRSIRKEMNIATNNAFVEKLDSNMYNNLYIDPALTRLTMNCKKEYVISVATFSETKEVGLLIDKIDISEENIVTDSLDFLPYHMTEYNNLAYDGTGIRIGVLETSSGDNCYYRFYETSNVHLCNKIISYRPASMLSQTATHHTDGAKISISEHTTTVMAILSGEHLESDNGEIYGGVAPNATLSLAQYLGEDDIYDAMDWLINEQNVNLINVSAGSSGGYTERCANFDTYVQQYRVTIVKSAGNSTNISSPGMSYNVVTVGNVGEMSNNIIAINDAKSSYEEPVNLTNKPDICAFGTNIYMLNNSYIPINYGSGTSFAAPQVTGTIALMLQKENSLIGNPHKVKAILLSSTYENAIYEEDDDPIMIQNPTTTAQADAIGITREKSGAGLLNVEGALSNTSNPMLFTYSYSRIANNTINTTHSYYEIAPGQIVKFGGLFEIDSDRFIFDTNEAEDITQNICTVSMNIRIVDTDGKIVFDSYSSTDPASKNDNVKMFAISFPYGGFYKFEVYFNTEDGVLITGFDPAVNVAMIVSCACGEPLITKERASNGTNECLDCSNCSFHIEEAWLGDIHNETFTTGTVSFVMQYHYDSMMNPTSICCTDFSVEFQPNDSTKSVAIVLESVNKTNTYTGYTEYRKYLILIFDANNESYAEFFVDVTIEYDSISLSYYLYG